MSSSLAVSVFKGQGPAYRALHLAGLDPQIEVLELIPLGDEAQVLAKGPAEGLQKWISSSQPLRSTVVENWDLRIEKAFYSLETNTLSKEVVFIEGPSLGELFQAASKALKAGWQIVDLKIPRGSVKWGTLVLTGVDSSAEALQATGLQVTKVSSPSPSLRRYFDIEG